jgi:hypothetical protein
MTSPVTTQGPAIQGMSTPQQGYAPGFPPPLGLEQYLGQPQQYGGYFPQYGGFPTSFGSPQQFPMQSQFPSQSQVPWQSQFPGQAQVPWQAQQFGHHHSPIQQIVPSLVTQLLPIAQQVILPQVVATATQQIPWYLQQLVTQQLAGQQSQFGPMGGRPYPGTF